MSKSLVVAVSCALAWPGPAAAYQSRDLMCMSIHRSEHGFTTRSQPGLSVRALVSAPGPFVNTLGDDLVAFTCFRDRALPEVDDVEVLQAGYALYLGSQSTGLRMIKLSLENGRVAYEVSGGELSGGERRSLDRIVVGMQARISASQP